MAVVARRLVRKMRGGAQAHLIEADDGRFWVVKFRNNPQHRRVLVNEMVSSVLLRHLQIACPETTLVRVTEEFLRENPETFIQLGTHREAIPPGWHFGSLYPGDPSRSAVYDYLPDALLGQVANVAEFLGVLVFDKWTANADSRQSVFLRARLRQWVPGGAAHPLKVGFAALMIDNGYAFDGPRWEFGDSPLQGLYFRPLVYANVRSWEDFQPWLDRVVHFPEEVLDDALKRVPREWLEGDEDAVQALLTRLMARRSQTPRLIEDCRRGRVDPFPHWT
jgi:hypothetical protein